MWCLENYLPAVGHWKPEEVHRWVGILAVFPLDLGNMFPTQAASENPGWERQLPCTCSFTCVSVCMWDKAFFVCVHFNCAGKKLLDQTSLWGLAVHPSNVAEYLPPEHLPCQSAVRRGHLNYPRIVQEPEDTLLGFQDVYDAFCPVAWGRIKYSLCLRNSIVHICPVFACRMVGHVCMLSCCNVTDSLRPHSTVAR